MYQCATISELHLPKTCFASGTERSLLCADFPYHWFSQGQSGSRVLLHKGLAKTFIRQTKHLVCLHCISALPKLYRRTCKSNITNVWHLTSVFLFSKDEQKKSWNALSPVGEHLCCNMHGLKIWWMYFLLKCLSNEQHIFLWKCFRWNHFMLLVRHLPKQEAGGLSSCVWM